MILLYNSLLGRYILIRQQVLLEKMHQLNRRLIRRTTLPFQSRTHWFEYIDNYRRVLYICGQIGEYSRFWQPYLTVMMLGFISDLSYLVYVLFFIRKVTWIQNLVLCPITLTMIVSLFFLTESSAKVVRGSGAILRANRQFLYLAGPNLRHRPSCLLKVSVEFFFGRI